jgi:hydrogenase maturation protease
MKPLVLCLGNELLGDDGVGLAAATALERALRGRADVRVSRQSGLYLLEQLEGYDTAIIADSVLGDRPGRVRELTPRETAPRPVPSAHHAGLLEALAVARAAGMRVPSRVRVIAMEIGPAQVLGAGLGPAVNAALPDFVAAVLGAVESEAPPLEVA